MAENKDFEAIMKEITGGLTGDPEADMKYLDEQGQKYKNHEYGKEILRACGRLMYELIPDDKKEELNKVLAKDNMGYDAAMEEVRFNVYKKNYDKALKLIEDMIAKYEKSEMFKDDAVSEYHCFREPMEEILYCEYTKPEKDIRRATYDYADMYLTYGSLLVELKRLDDAADALFTAMKWNPAYAGIAFEYAETFKMRGMIEEFKDITKGIFKYAYRPEALARITSMEQTPLEKAESLEQLRWLENGMHITVRVVDIETVGIDTPEDLERAEKFLLEIKKAKGSL